MPLSCMDGGGQFGIDNMSAKQHGYNIRLVALSKCILVLRDAVDLQGIHSTFQHTLDTDYLVTCCTSFVLHMSVHGVPL